MNEPIKLNAELKRLYLSYLESAMPFRYSSLSQERLKLLSMPGVLCQHPIIEFVKRYKTTQRLHDFCRANDLSALFADLVCSGLFPKEAKLYKHQEQALVAAACQRQHVVVTSGTGSGKTECFLFPIMEALVREAQNAKQERSAAVRALILYPLNALAEDQMVRLRRGLDSVDTQNGSGARTWYKQHNIKPFTFGRYTGRTPPRASDDLAKIRREIERQSRAVADLKSKLPEKEWLKLRYQFTQLDQGPDEAVSELWNRQLMQRTPPDILITNHSMLNVMLVRNEEEPIFEATRRWLAADSSRVFHLVVDELHSYRGTPGTEVAYLIRLLLHRLDVSPDSPQVRFLASSASLEKGPEGDRFLREFFATEPTRFDVLAGEPETPEGQFSSSLKAATFERFEQVWPSDPQAAAIGLYEELTGGNLTQNEEPARLLNRAIQESSLLSEFRECVSGVRLPQEIATSILGSSSLGSEAASGLLRSLIEARDEEGAAPLPMRAHLFFRNLRGLWACCNPKCDQATEPGERPVGKLYHRPNLVCACGSRVLDLLVCRCCGEVFLGGHRSRLTDDDGEHCLFLVHDQPDLERIPQRTIP